MVDWSLLPTELLQLISKFVESYFDLLHFRGVCTSWRASAPLRPPPIFCSNDRFDKDDPDFKYFLSKRTVFLFQSPSDRKTPNFWLARLDEDEFGKKHFYNPLYWGKPTTVMFSATVLDLSKIHVQELCNQYVKKVDIGNGYDALRTIAYTDMSLCVVDRFTFMGNDNNVITFEQNDNGVLIFRKFGGEELSTIVVQGFSKCVDFIQFESKCYATDFWGNTICVDPFSKTSFLMGEEFAVDPFARVTTAGEFRVAKAAIEKEIIMVGSVVLRRRCKYLVELCGNLLLVQVVMTGEKIETSAFRCEVLQLNEERKGWDPVVSLSDAILFVGKFCKFSVPAIPGVEGDRVVFTFREGLKRDEIRDFDESAFVFHLSSGTIVPLDHCLDLLALFNPPSF